MEPCGGLADLRTPVASPGPLPPKAHLPGRLARLLLLPPVRSQPRTSGWSQEGSQNLGRCHPVQSWVTAPVDGLQTQVSVLAFISHVTSGECVA